MADKKPIRVSRLGKENQELTAFNEGEEIRGTFVYMKISNIRDRVSGERKDIRIYVIRTKEGDVARISSRAMLDDCFDELVAMNGGIDKLQGREMSFIRGEDVPNGNGDPMGTYAIDLY